VSLLSALIWSSRSASLSLFCVCAHSGPPTPTRRKEEEQSVPSRRFFAVIVSSLAVMECSENENNKTQCQECATQIRLRANDLSVSARRMHAGGCFDADGEKERDAI
jgi:hypothetical protein